jgi:Uma2 family endonuclease
MLEVPDSLLAERRQLGLDRRDEMWEGELHMVPPPKEVHGRIATWFAAMLWPLARAAGLRVSSETGVFDPAVADFSSYRVPDVVVYGPSATSERGVEGRAELVVEVRSPSDESYQKLPFYERVGVAEVLIMERDGSLRRWRGVGGRRVEEVAAPGAWMALDTLPVRLRFDGRTWVMDTPEGETAL